MRIVVHARIIHQQLFPAFRMRIGQWDGGKQRTCIWMKRMAVQRFGIRQLDNLPQMNDRNAVADMDAFVLLGELTISEEAPEETPAPEPQAPFLQTGDYAAVTTETRVYLSIDESMTEDDNGDDWQGVFTRDAVVSVESVQQDALGRDWCEVRYLYGADDADGKLIWTDTDISADRIWVTDITPEGRKQATMTGTEGRSLIF